MLMEKNNFIGIKGLQNLKDYLQFPTIYADDCMDKNITVFITDVGYYNCAEIKLRIYSNAKTYSQKLKDIYKIYNLVRKNQNYRDLKIEIHDEKTIESLYNNKIKHYLDTDITIQLD